LRRYFYEAIAAMALLEQQWVTVQQKTFTKWSDTQCDVDLIQRQADRH